MNNDALDLLIGIKELGYKEETFQLSDEISVTLKTLNSKEDSEVYDELEDMKKGTKFLSQYKIKTLARSIIKVNANKFETQKDDDENQDDFREKQLKIKETIIASWSGPVIDDMFEKYSNLLGKANAFIIKQKDE